MLDIRGLPTPVCPCCGSTLLRLTVQFDPETYEIQMYLLDDAKCVECHCLITAPTPLDHPNHIWVLYLGCMNLHEIIADILYDHLKGKHKDDLSIKLANQIIEASAEYYEGLSEPS